MGYWSTPSKLIKEGELGLGWLERTVELTTPMAFQITRGRAESSGTQSDEPQRRRRRRRGPHR
jgi:hypothetical protein